MPLEKGAQIFLVDIAEDYKSLRDFCNLMCQPMIRAHPRKNLLDQTQNLSHKMSLFINIDVGQLSIIMNEREKYWKFLLPFV
jgi:hypothetical protein